jgi:hypothetical protein
MNDKVVTPAVDQFLRTVCYSAQKEIEKVVRNAVASGKLKLHEPVTAAVALSSEKIGLNVTIYSKIVL